MYGCESSTVKKAEHKRIDAFELWCWRRLLWVPWTARRSNQTIIKEISPGVHWKDLCWSWNSNTLATSCEELTHWKRPWCLEGLGVGGGGDDRGWDGWMATPTQWTWVWVNSGSWWWAGRPGMLRFMGSQRVGHDWATELINNVIMNILVCFYLNIGFQFFRYIPRSRIAVSHDDSVFKWLSNHWLFCTIPSPYYISMSSICGFSFAHILTNIYYYLTFWMKLKLQSFGHLVWREDLLEKTLMLGKIEGRRRTGRQDEMPGWHHWLKVHDIEQTLENGEAQGSLVCCSPWGHKELDMT